MSIYVQNRTFKLFTKWRCDDASGQSIYKEKFSSQPSQDSDIDDCSIFTSTLASIKLYDPESSEVIWKNLKSSSPIFCRPIRFAFCKETPEVINKAVLPMQSATATLSTIFIETTEIHHQLIMTMMNGKLCTVLSQTSSALRCYICGATPQ